MDGRIGKRNRAAVRKSRQINSVIVADKYLQLTLFQGIMYANHDVPERNRGVFYEEA